MKKFKCQKKKKGIFSFLSLSKIYIYFLGPAMKSRGHLHPILLSPARISELNTVSKTSEGEFLVFLCNINPCTKLLFAE